MKQVITLCGAILFGVLIVAGPIRLVAQDSDEDILRLGLTQLRLKLEQENIDDAFVQLEKLKKKFPNNTAVAIAEAEAYMHIGHWRQAIAQLDRAQTIAPNDEDISILRETASKHRTSSATLDREIVLIGENELKQISRVTGNRVYDDHITLGASYEHNHIRTDIITRSNGRSQKVKDDVSRGRVTLKYDHDDSDLSSISLLGGETTVGISGEHSWLDRYGETRIKLVFQEPNWDYTEGVIDNATKDLLSIYRRHRLDYGFEVFGGAGVARYGIDDDPNVAHSGEFTAGINYSIPTHLVTQRFLGKDSYLSLNYGFYAEYGFDLETRIDTFGSLFNPIPLTSYEIHDVSLYVSKVLTPSVHIEGYGGYAYDRLGEGGASLSAEVVFEPVDEVEISVRALRDVSTEDSNDTQDIVGVSIKRLF